jgi:hypothetical protein
MIKKKNTPWSAEEEAMLAQAVVEKISPARLCVRLQRSEASIKRRMRELGLAGQRRALAEVARSQIEVRLDPRMQANRLLHACRARNLVELSELYAEDAMLECACAGPAIYAGATAISEYWSPKISTAAEDGFSLVDLHMDNNGRVVVDYLSYEAKPVRMFLSFDAAGKIVRSECGPRRCPDRMQPDLEERVGHKRRGEPARSDQKHHGDGN